MALMWALWLLLIIPLALYGRTPREAIIAATPQPSVPERLRQLLETAERESLSVEQQTDLKKLLLSFWAEQLGVSSARLVHTLEKLRQHPSAGPQLASVERWLQARRASVNGSVARELLTELG